MRLAVFTVLAVLAMAGAAASPTWAGDHRWTRFGPGVGGVTAFTVDPRLADTSYMAQELGGVQKSVDGGRHWTLSSQGLGQQTITELAAWRSSLFALDARGKLYRSDDHGGRWGVVHRGEAFAGLGREEFEPYQGPHLVFAAGADPAFYLRLRSGIYRSGDQGRSWERVFHPEEGTVGALAADPTAPGTLYAGLADLPEGAPTLLKSTDGGATWAVAGVPVEGFFPGGGVRALAVLPTRPATVFAASSYPGFFRSADGGATWERVRFEPGVDYLMGAVIADPFVPARVYATSVGGLWISQDAGRTWRASPTAPFDLAVSLGVDPVTRIVYGASGQGVFRSPAGARRWQSVYTITLQIDEIVFHPQDPAHLFAIGGHLLESVDGGRTWSDPMAGKRPVFSTAVRALEFAPDDPSVLYAGTIDAVFRSRDGGQSWERLGVDPGFSLRSLAVLEDGTLLVGACGIQRSTDGGRTWRRVFACARPGTDPFDESGRVPGELLVDPGDPETVYAEVVEYQGRHHPDYFWNLYKSTDGGRTWRRILEEGQALAVDPGQPSRLVTVKLDGTVLESVNAGLGWRRVGSLAVSEIVTDLRIDPAAPATLYAATGGSGVFRSTDGGRTWAAINNGLGPELQELIVYRLFLHPTLPHRLYAEASQQVFGARF